MTQRRRQEQREPITPTEVVRRRVRELRDAHAWSARELAERCQSAGLDGFTRSLLANIESERRGYVTVDELYVLALVLDASPAMLLDPGDDDRVAIGTHVADGSAVWDWLSYEQAIEPLDGQDEQAFRRSATRHPFSLMWAALLAGDVDKIRAIAATAAELWRKRADHIADVGVAMVSTLESERGA